MLRVKPRSLLNTAWTEFTLRERTYNSFEPSIVQMLLYFVTGAAIGMAIVGSVYFTLENKE